MIPTFVLRLLLATAAPLSPEAEASVHRAEHYVAMENYEAARAALAEAAAMQQHPAIIFARAQVERLAGDCASAIEFYRQFAQLQSDPEDAAEAHRWIADCQQHMPQPSPDPTPAAPPPLTAAPETPAMQPPPRPDPWGVALLGMGAGTLAAGIGTLVAGRVLRPDPARVPTEADYGDAAARSTALQRAGFALAPVGAALVIAGGIRLVAVARRRRFRPESTSTLVNAMTSLTVRF